MNSGSNQSNQNNQNNQNNPTPRSGPNFFNVFVVILLITMFINMISTTMANRKTAETTYTQFVDLVKSGNVSDVWLEEGSISYTLGDDADLTEAGKILNGVAMKSGGFPGRTFTYVTGAVNDPKIVELLTDHEVEIHKAIVQPTSTAGVLLSWILPMLVFYLFYYFIIRNISRKISGMGSGGAGGVFSVGKSKAKEYEVEEETGVTFRDVAGQDEAKESLMEMVDFLHNPAKYTSIGAKQPKGALLVGPPGTGKTLLARAVAGEAKVPFYHLSGSEFVEMFVGVGASRVRDLFATASKNAPAIVFIDEIDAIGKKRDSSYSSNDEREQTLNQLLAEMDGFDPAKGIIVLAATNRPEVLDKALLRPGRFDRQIQVELPDLPGRQAILEVHAKKVKIAPDVNLKDVALATGGTSGADLANIINEAALRAVKMGRKSVVQEDLMEAVEVVIAGQEKRDRVMNPKERRMVAYHEVGHALVTALQKDAEPVHKITIIPRTKGSLGYTMSLPEEERYLLTKEDLLAQINTLMGGRAAEIVEFGVQTTGASNDIERATQLARRMVTQFGMSDTFGPMGLESTQNQYLDGRNVSTVSEQTNTMVDEEVKNILSDSQKAAIDLLSNNRDALTAIAEFLLEKETVTGEEFMELLHETQAKRAAQSND